MACDAQEGKLDDLIIPTDLKLCKLFLTRCPNELAPYLGLSWL